MINTSEEWFKPDLLKEWFESDLLDRNNYKSQLLDLVDSSHKKSEKLGDIEKNLREVQSHKIYFDKSKMAFVLNVVFKSEANYEAEFHPLKELGLPKKTNYEFYELYFNANLNYLLELFQSYRARLAMYAAIGK